METEIKLEDILKEMREIIGDQAQQIAILKANIALLLSKEATPTS